MSEKSKCYSISTKKLNRKMNEENSKIKVLVCVLDNNCYCQDLQFGLDGRFYRQPTPQNRQILFFKSLWDVKWQCHIGLTPSNQPSTTTTTDKKSNIDDDIKPMSEDDAQKRRQTILNEMFLTNFFF